ncbi:MAG: hypothetical protein ABI167_12865 [Nitrosospira sp.]
MFSMPGTALLARTCLAKPLLSIFPCLCSSHRMVGEWFVTIWTGSGSTAGGKASADPGQNKHQPVTVADAWSVPGH